MRVTFFLPIEPFSVNRMYYRDKRHKTQEYRDWELSVVHAMSAKVVQQKFKQIREAFDPAKHCFIVWLDTAYPKQILFNKAGQISSKAEDLSNIEKPIIDMLFLPKVHVQPAPWGCPNVNADDKYILRMSSRKSISRDNKYWLKVSIAVVDLPALPGA